MAHIISLMGAGFVQSPKGLKSLNIECFEHALSEPAESATKRVSRGFNIFFPFSVWRAEEGKGKRKDGRSHLTFYVLRFAQYAIPPRLANSLALWFSSERSSGPVGAPPFHGSHRSSPAFTFSTSMAVTGRSILLRFMVQALHGLIMIGMGILTSIWSTARICREVQRVLFQRRPILPMIRRMLLTSPTFHLPMCCTATTATGALPT